MRATFPIIPLVAALLPTFLFGAPAPDYVPPRQAVSGSSSEKGGQNAVEHGAGAENLGSVGRLNEMRDRYLGKMVAVQGDVKQKLDERSFVLENGNSNDRLVVVGSPKLSPSALKLVQADRSVQVKGTVKELNLAEAKKEFGWKLNDEQSKELGKLKTYLVAVSIEPSEEKR